MRLNTEEAGDRRNVHHFFLQAEWHEKPMNAPSAPEFRRLIDLGGLWLMVGNRKALRTLLPRKTSDSHFGSDYFSNSQI
jgi:hypothetical protein